MRPKQARKPCWGCGREVRIVSTTLGGGLARFRRPEHEPLGRPFGILLVGLGHMGGHRAVAALEERTLVAGHPCALVEDFDDLRTQTYFELLLDQAIGHGIIVAVDVDMVIDVHADQFPLGIFIGLRRQGAQGGTLQRLEDALAGAGEFLKRAPIEGDQ